jgi:predicted RNase H-like HicB family nuclease
MKYRVVLKQTDEGYSVSCPGLPGCWSQGETEAEAIDNIRDAIAEYQAAVAATFAGQDVREIDVAE